MGIKEVHHSMQNPLGPHFFMATKCSPSPSPTTKPPHVRGLIFRQGCYQPDFVAVVVGGRNSLPCAI